MPKQPTKQELQERLARAERQNGAYYEWFRSVERGEAEHEMSFTIYEPSREIRVLVRTRGMVRPAGGVVLVRHEENDTYGAPEYLSDLISRWLHEPSPYVQDAARKLMRAQEDALALVAKGYTTAPATNAVSAS